MPLPPSVRTAAPADPILGLMEAFRLDPRPDKVSLASGVFVDDQGRTPVLPSVLEAERRLLAAAGTKLYRPIDGDPAYRTAVRDLVLGADHEAVRAGRVAVAQVPGGTGGLRVAADLLHQAGATGTVWVSDPTWPNHPQLFRAAGFAVRSYPYTDPSGRRIDEPALLAALEAAQPGDVLVLHGACHNPTGVDPSPDLWRRLADLVERRGLLPLIDLAYQGFGEGLREDAAGMLELVRPGAEVLISTSFSKTFSLYAERVGALLIVTADAADVPAVTSHVKVAIRTNYSNPPAHGADIVATILGDPALRVQWEGELAAMRNRIRGNRVALVTELQARGIPGDWTAIGRQKGMFALLGLEDREVTRLREEFGFYLVARGRINVAGFTADNLPRFVEALATTLGA